MAKDMWFSSMDKNSRYFYSIVKGRRVRKKILRIHYADGTWSNDENRLKGEFVEYYKQLLGSCAGMGRQISCEVIQEGPVLLECHKVTLMQDFDDSDVRRVVWDIDDSKAPGTDDYTAAFYKKSWAILGKDLTQAI